MPDTENTNGRPPKKITPEELYKKGRNTLLEHFLFFWYRILLGRKAGSEKESNNRRGWCRFSLLLIFVIFGALPFVQDMDSIPSYLKITSFIAVAWSAYFFFLVVVIIPFRASDHFEVNAARLGGDGLLSIALSITAFSFAYVVFGLEPPTEGESLRLRDHIYFSAVTFSTLGFGDITPARGARLYAAAQAIIGNLHLGIVVGTAFFAASNGKKPKTP